jgi:hypothetical protein
MEDLRKKGMDTKIKHSKQHTRVVRPGSAQSHPALDSIYLTLRHQVCYPPKARGGRISFAVQTLLIRDK